MTDFDAQKIVDLINNMQEYLRQTNLELEGYKQSINNEVLRVDQ